MRLLLLATLIFAASCTISSGASPGNSGGVAGENARVTRVIDGDTIDVRIGDSGYRVRYIGVNTPERDEACYAEATDANAILVRDQTVTLVKDTSETDQYGRLLRYVYVGDTFVNASLVRDGWAESVEYPPDTARASEFRGLERDAAAANRGCHPSGIFNDGSTTR